MTLSTSVFFKETLNKYIGVHGYVYDMFNGELDHKFMKCHYWILYSSNHLDCIGISLLGVISGGNVVKAKCSH